MAERRDKAKRELGRGTEMQWDTEREILWEREREKYLRARRAKDSFHHRGCQERTYFSLG